MKFTKIFLNFFTSLAIVISLNACSNSNEDKTTEDNKIITNETTDQSTEISDQISTKNSLSLKMDLEKAKKDGKAVFVVVTGTGSMDTDKALKIAEGANDIYKNGVVIQMNKDDTANTQYNIDWRLSGAPLPLILVISPKGQLSGGLVLNQATSESIAALVPSPKLEEVYEAIGNKKTAIVVFSKKSIKDKADVLKACNKTVSILKNNAVIVEVDMEDSKEASFMNQVRVNSSSNESITLVINTQGQLAGTATSIPDSKKLAEAATQPVKSGCGPGCGPAGCEK